MPREWKEGESCVVCGTTSVRFNGRGMCVNCYNRWWRKQKPENHKNTQKKYRSTEKWRETEKAYNESDAGKKANLEKATRYREKNKETCLERTREWRDENRGYIKEYNDSKRVSKWRHKYGEDAVRLLRECGFKCQKCGSDKLLSVHHIDWDKTHNEYSNFSILCGSCHFKLHSWIPARLRRQIFEEWMTRPLAETEGSSRN